MICAKLHDLRKIFVLGDRLLPKLFFKPVLQNYLLSRRLIGATLIRRLIRISLWLGFIQFLLFFFFFLSFLFQLFLTFFILKIRLCQVVTLLSLFVQLKQ